MEEKIMVTRQKQPSVEYNTQPVDRVILEFDTGIAGLSKLAALLVNRYGHLPGFQSTQLENRVQRLVFSAGMSPVVIGRELYKQAGPSVGWERLPDFVLRSGFVVGFADNEIVIGVEPPATEAVYRPAPDPRPGADGAVPPEWSSSMSLRNTRPRP
jgi:hypothetical protein